MASVNLHKRQGSVAALLQAGSAGACGMSGSLEVHRNCSGLRAAVMRTAMAWVTRGHCRALGSKNSSTPAVVTGAAPALAKAGVGGFFRGVGIPPTRDSSLMILISSNISLGQSEHEDYT